MRGGGATEVFGNETTIFPKYRDIPAVPYLKSGERWCGSHSAAAIELLNSSRQIGAFSRTQTQQQQQQIISITTSLVEVIKVFTSFLGMLVKHNYEI
jgi:hypothetical protein